MTLVTNDSRANMTRFSYVCQMGSVVPKRFLILIIESNPKVQFAQMMHMNQTRSHLKCWVKIVNENQCYSEKLDKINHKITKN